MLLTAIMPAIVRVRSPRAHFVRVGANSDNGVMASLADGGPAWR